MRSKMTPQSLAKAVARVKAGESVPAVARDYGIARENMWRLVKRYGQGYRLGHAWDETVCAPIPTATAAYVAGLFDGEGSISCRKYPSRGRVQQHWIMRIGMTNEAVIRWLGTIGGKVKSVPNGRRGNRKPMFGWFVSRQRDVRILLTAMRPYLIVKAEKADQVLADLNGRLE